MIAFRKSADMLVLFPKRQLAHYTDNTMPRRDWSQFDAPAADRNGKPKANVARLRIQRALRMTP
jgi:hypothetical protein